MNVRRYLAGIPALAFAVVGALAVTGCGSPSEASTPPSAAPPAPTALLYEIRPDAKAGPDGKQHDSFFELNPHTVKVGQQVTIEVTNYDGGQHSMTFTDLGLNLVIPGKDKASGNPGTYTFTFTPTSAGKFRWYCALPCDGGANARWAMSDSTAGPGQDDFMAGYVTVVAK